MAEIRTQDGRRTKARKYEIKELRERHHEILRRALLGQKRKEIATALGVTEKNVSDVMNSELGKQQMQILQQVRDVQTLDLAEEISNVAPKSLKVLRTVVERTEQMIDQDPTYIPTAPLVKVSQDVLDRAGYGAVKRKEERHSHMHFTLAEVERMRERALKRAHDIPTNGDEIQEAEVIEEDNKEESDASTI